MYRLTNTLRHYAWGSTSAMAAFLATEPSGLAEAELWLGAHPGSPSRALLPNGSTMPLDSLIAESPENTLGATGRAAFGDQLPFLMKVLAAGSPLSLQVHPNRQQARAGFELEEQQNVPKDAEHRNYKDPNHKPEMIVAVSGFEALCGFRPVAESRMVFQHLLNQAPAGAAPAAMLADVIEALGNAEESTALRSAFLRLNSSAEDIQGVAAIAETSLNGGNSPHRTELSTLLELHSLYPGDPGALISLLLNHVSLEPGQAVFLPAGNLHAYLGGLGIEVMASSDNVLRCGLTPKHVDIPELLKVLDFRSVPVPLLEPSATHPGERLWEPPFREFQLQRLQLGPDSKPTPLAQNGPAIVLVTSGAMTLQSPQRSMQLRQGESVFIPACEAPVMVHEAKELSMLYCTTGAVGCS